MKTYIKPEESVDDGSDDDGRKKNKRAKKDKNAPKGALTAFFVFSNEVRGKVALY